MASLSQTSLELSREIGDRRSQAYAVRNLACVVAYQGDYARARSLAEQSLALFRELGDVPGTLHTLALPIWMAMAEGDLQRATEAAHQMLAVAREAGDVDGTAFALNSLGHVALRQGDYGAARPLLSESAGLFEEVGNKRLRALTLLTLGVVALKQGDREQASTLLRQYLIGLREVSGYWPGDVELGLQWLAELVAEEGREHGRVDQVLKATRLLAAVEVLYKQMASWGIDAHDRAEYERQIADVRAQLDGVAFAAAWAEGKAMTPEQAIAFALEDD